MKTTSSQVKKKKKGVSFLATFVHMQDLRIPHQKSNSDFLLWSIVLPTDCQRSPKSLYYKKFDNFYLN